MKKIYKPLLFLMVFTLILGGMYWKSVQDIPNPNPKSVDPNPANQEISKVSENLIPTEELTQKPNSSTNSQEKSTTNNIGRKKRNITAPTQSSATSTRNQASTSSSSSTSKISKTDCKECKRLTALINGQPSPALKAPFQKKINNHPFH